LTGSWLPLVVTLNSPVPNKLDKIDLKILAALQKDSSISNVELANDVGVSPAACSRRVKRLRDTGAIVREVAVINPAIIGRHMTAIIEVTFDRHSASHKEAFLRQIYERPEVSQCYMVTGDSDLILFVHVVDMEAYDVIRTRLFDSNPNVVRYRTVFSIRCVKSESAIQIDLSAS
jgi:Lrp/AsnC family leucine-responsive transcriptional regulator